MFDTVWRLVLDRESDETSEADGERKRRRRERERERTHKGLAGARAGIFSWFLNE